jgi:uncharacterized sodium:solute symporter family permease YidK
MMMLAADDGGMRGLLLALVVVAIILILSGCVIAIFTLFSLRRGSSASTSEAKEN